LVDRNKYIIHKIVHPVVEDYDTCYMVIMFIENGKIAQVASVELKRNFISFDDTKSNPNVYYAFSSN